uniref:Protein Wnt n=1 Tax=Lutzomyia longipalpis TaxID=7200 RepID=A0A1B0CVR7_LUTLO
MDLSVLVFIYLLAICTSSEVESKHKPGRGRGSMWWGIAKVGEPNNLSPLNSKILYMDPAIHSTLRRKQRRLVRENPGVLGALVRGANMAIAECQHQFRHRRWNCSTRNFLRGKNLFGKIVDRGCRETAFIYAITSAAVTHSIAKACSEGTIESCTCDYSHQSKVTVWEWGGCSDNIGFGIKFAREFVDTGERGRNFREKMNLHNNEAGRAVSCRETAFIYAITSAAVTHSIAKACSEGTIESCTCDYSHQSKVTVWEWGGCSDNIGFGIKFAREFVDTGERGRNFREKMNLHNNEAGRACHGMSGSCTVKTCWMRLPNFRVVGDNLKDRFDGASRVMVSNSLRSSNGGANENAIKVHSSSNALQVSHTSVGPNSISSNSVHVRGHQQQQQQQQKRYNRYHFQLKPYNPEHKPPGVMDLVYLEPSPGFCERNPRLGIQGTHGRQCNDTSIGVDGCDLMCCGRGYRTQEVTVVERCACMFHWCCEVKCKLCRIQKTIHTCL